MADEIKIKLENDCLKINLGGKVHVLKKQTYKSVNKSSVPVIDPTNIKLSKFKHDNRYLVDNK